MKAREGLEVQEVCLPDFAELIAELSDLDFGFIGGVIVATGIILTKPFVLALF